MAERFFEGLGYSLLNEFIGIFRSKEGFAKTSRYEVVISPPKGLASATSNPGGFLPDLFSNSTSEVRKISYYCETIDFPGRTLLTREDTSGYGPIRQVVYGETFEDVAATFYLSNDHREQKFFYNWQNITYSNDDDFATGYYAAYISNVDIYQLDEEDRRRIGIRLFEAYPKSIGTINVSYGSANQIAKLPVGFGYRYWRIIDGEESRNFLNRIANTLVNVTERKVLASLPKVLRRL